VFGVELTSSQEKKDFCRYKIISPGPEGHYHGEVGKGGGLISSGRGNGFGTPSIHSQLKVTVAEAPKDCGANMRKGE